MGLWKILTTPINLGNDSLRWREPHLMGMRLRRDSGRRLALAAACIVAGAALIALALALGGAARVPVAAVAIGALFGAWAAMYAALRNDDWRGNVICGRDGIEWRRTYPALLTMLETEQRAWPWQSISRCVIARGESIGHRFSVLAVSSDESLELLGIAPNVDIDDLAARLGQHGVKVSFARRLPDQCTQPGRKGPLVAAACSLAALLALVSLIVVPRWGGDPNLARGGKVIREPSELAPLAETDLDLAPGGPPLQAPEVEGDPEFGMAEPAQMSAPAAPAKSASGSRDTVLVGSRGGFDFRTVDPNARPMTGLNHATGEWAGKLAISRLEPVYEGDTSADAAGAAVARPGYAVGALDIDVAEFIVAVRVVFMRQAGDGRLDPEDTYSSDWLGQPSGNPPQRLSGDGNRLIGIYGRSGAVLDALGLVIAAP